MEGKTAPNEFSSCYSNIKRGKLNIKRGKLNIKRGKSNIGVRIGNFVFILTNVRFYVSPMREIILAVLTSSLVVHFSLSPKRFIWGSL